MSVRHVTNREGQPLLFPLLLHLVCHTFQSSETYLDIDVMGAKMQCLVDSGCDHSIIPKSKVKEAKLSPAKIDLFAANGTKIPVLGQVRMQFTVNGLPLYADFCVTEDVDECILGYDWLRRNRCWWLFDKSVLVVDGKTVRLKNRPSRANVRRIYVRETVSVPAQTQINVPLRMPLSNLRAPASDWVTEAKEFRPGLLMGRTLLLDCDPFAAVQFVNLSDKTQRLCSGLFPGRAEPGFVVNQSGQAAEAERAGAAVGGVTGLDVSGPSACAPTVTSVAISEPDRLPDKDCLPCAGPENTEPSRLGLRKPNRLGVYGADPAGDVIFSDHGNWAESAAISEPNRLASGPDSLADPVRVLTGSQPTVVAEFVDGCANLSDLPDSDSSFCCRSILSASLTSESMHVEPVALNSMPDDLTVDERCRAAKLIVDNADLFSAPEFDFGRTNKLTHRIDTGQSRPIAQPLRRHPRVYLDLIDQTVDTLLQAGVVEPAASPWSSNVVLVARPGNPVPRVTVDYRALNAVTYKDKFPLPKIRDSLDALSGSVYFSVMDFSASFFSFL